MTDHFFSENFDYILVIFSFGNFSGRHSSTLIKPFIIAELQKLEIEESKIVASTSDNGANVKSAFQTGFGIWCSCFCHNFNLILKPFFKHESSDNSNGSNNSNNFDTSDDEDEDEEQAPEEEL